MRGIASVAGPVGTRDICAIVALVFLGAAVDPGSAAVAQSVPPATSAGSVLSPTRMLSEQSGEALFVNVCRGCHMADAEGAVGAGAYPALAGDGNLAAGGYPVYVVVNGLRGMPAVGRMMTDDQVAMVVNYVRTHFGNHYDDIVTSTDVKASRP